jgi:hypothetical protein
MSKHSTRRRVHKKRKAGINFDAPYWHGERAEDIVAKRVASYKKKKVRKPSSRKTK